jgi:hypothetical protein
MMHILRKKNCKLLVLIRLKWKATSCLTISLGNTENVYKVSVTPWCVMCHDDTHHRTVWLWHVLCHADRDNSYLHNRKEASDHHQEVGFVSERKRPSNNTKYRIYKQAKCWHTQQDVIQVTLFLCPELEALDPVNSQAQISDCVG